MARIRSIHPGIFTDEAFVSVSVHARLLFIGVWCEADDQGIFEWRPLTLRMRIFPTDTVDIAAVLAELASLDMVRSFTADGRQYGAVRNFCLYQRPKFFKALFPLPAQIAPFVAASGKAQSGPLNHSRDLTAADRKRRQRQRERGQQEVVTCSAVTSTVTDRDIRDISPPPGEQVQSHGSSVTSHGSSVTEHEKSRVNRDELSRDREMSRLMERRGEERDKSLLGDSDICHVGKPIRTKPARKAKNEDFERFRAAYPKRDGTDPKEPARKRFEVAVKGGADPEMIIAGAKAFAAAERKRNNVGSRFIPHSSSWLNRRGWEDHQAQPSASPAAEAESWRIPVDSWRRDPSTWNSHAWGPAPGELGCKVPPSLLVGFASTSPGQRQSATGRH